MGLFHNISNIFKRSATESAGVTTTSPRLGAVSLMTNVSGDPLTVAAVYRCINLLSDKVAVLPLQYMKKKGSIFVEDSNSRLNYLLNVRPNSYMSAFDIKKRIVIDLLTKGNAYIVPVYDNLTMDYAALMLVNPVAVSHNIQTDTYTIMDATSGVHGTYAESEIIHIKNFTIDGKTGLSTLAYARQTINIGLAADQEQLQRIANGGAVRGFLSNDTSVKGFGEYADDAMDKLSEDINYKLQNGQHIVALHGQTTFQQAAMSSADMQFIESQRYNTRQIARLFNVPPSFLYDDTSNNYKSAEQAATSLLSDGIAPILKKIQDELDGKLITPALASKRKFVFDKKELMTCDLDSMVNYQTKSIAAGISTPNEWRQYENKEALEGGDAMYLSANLKSAKELSNPTPAPVQTPNTDNNGEE